jgi:hypothetical protein
MQRTHPDGSTGRTQAAERVRPATVATSVLRDFCPPAGGSARRLALTPHRANHAQRASDFDV